MPDPAGLHSGDPAVQAARRPGRAWRWLTFTVIAALSFFWLAPLLWLVCAVFRTREAMFSTVFLPESLSVLTFDNFRQLFSAFDFLRYLANSFLSASAGTVLAFFCASLSGFALAKYAFPGRAAVQILLLILLAVPNALLLAPTYELAVRLGWVDSYAGLLLPGALSVVGVFLFRQALLGIPDELLEAGRLDGCSEWRLYWSVALPCIRPTTAVFCLTHFIGLWNAFLWPAIVLHSEQRFTVPIALYQTVGLPGSNQYGLLLAGTLIGLLPPTLFFALMQREFIAGLTRGAVKG